MTVKILWNNLQIMKLKHAVLFGVFAAFGGMAILFAVLFTSSAMMTAEVSDLPTDLDTHPFVIAFKDKHPSAEMIGTTSSCSLWECAVSVSYQTLITDSGYVEVLSFRHAYDTVDDVTMRCTFVHSPENTKVTRIYDVQQIRDSVC